MHLSTLGRPVGRRGLLIAASALLLTALAGQGLLGDSLTLR